MNVVHDIQNKFISTISTICMVPLEVAQQVGRLTLQVNQSTQSFGDLSSVAALQLAPILGKSPRTIAQLIIEQFTDERIERIELAGPGFINMFLTHEAFVQLAIHLINHTRDFFIPDNLYKQKYSVEFVSANPTGPLHFGHGRGGIIGDVVGNVLRFIGHPVTKEFYINDAGSQITKLGLSLRARYLELLNIPTPVPEEGYHGAYLIEVAQELITKHGTRLQDHDEQYFATLAQHEMLERIEKTLSDYGITYDVWFSEKILHDTGAIDEALTFLEHAGYLYTQDGALWFASTKFGDDKDRVVRKATGELTYVAADLAYLQNKVARGHTKLLMVLGHDHHGYSERLHAAMGALALDKKATLDIILYQLVHIVREQEYVRMSKRKGTIVTLDDVIAAVGRDVARFFYIYRKADAQLDFDFTLATTQSEENPVYYIQYALVRTRSILHKAAQHTLLCAITADDAVYLKETEHLLLKKIISLQDILHTIATTYQPHLLAYYAHELAQIFNRYYGKYTVVDAEQASQSRGRLVMTTIVRDTLLIVCDLLGISAPERM